MFRWSTVILLIATIVACPFRCGGAFGDVCAAESAGESANQPTTCGCGCCRQERPPSPENEPDSPLPEPCDCGSCVCEGAVLPEKVAFVADDSLSAPICATVSLTVSLQGAQVESIRGAVPDVEPSSGRDLRVLHRSLLL